jgi:uncharacterized protein YhaN
MILLRLTMKPFGIFADASIEFTGDAGKVNVVYGDNEAGKSTSLRALQHLLFGFEHRRSNDFRFPAAKLRVMGEVAAQRGAQSRVFRRKRGNRNTLLDADENAISEAELTQLLAQLDQERFTQLFALDHVRLRQGGEALAQGGGALQQSLFSAALGRDVQGVLRELQERADAIFRPRGRTQALTSAANRYEETMDEFRELEVPPQRVTELRQQGEELRKQLQAIGGQLEDLQRQKSRAERLLNAARHLHAWRQARQCEAELADVVDPGEDAAGERKIAEGARRNAEEARGGATAHYADRSGTGADHRR